LSKESIYQQAQHGDNFRFGRLFFWRGMSYGA
jgi:hypothetical protein